jgi:hypothetical protein
MHTIVNVAAIKAAVVSLPRLVPPPPEDEEHSPPSTLLALLKRLCVRSRTNIVVSSVQLSSAQLSDCLHATPLFEESLPILPTLPHGHCR